MRKRLFAGIAFIGLTVLIFTGCSKMPQTEIDAANAAVSEAEAAGADVYVHEDFVKLQDSLNGVIVRIETQSSKLIKNYSKAKEELAGVVQNAGEVKLLAENRKEELKIEIQNSIASVKALIESNRQLILQAPKGKEGTSALIAIKGEVDALEISVNETSNLFETGDYLATLEKVSAANEKASSINAELTAVIAKYKANVRTR